MPDSVSAVILSPRYGDKPVVSVEVRDPGPHPVVKQRARLEAVLQSLAPDEWHQPSRCEGWSVQDVITHLTSATQFWAVSIQSGAAGEPTRFLASFDPVSSPAQMVDQSRGTPPGETLQQFSAACAALAAAVGSLDDAGWDALGEAPTGHVPIRLVADHALWDSWIHERDVVLPLGRAAVVDDDEVLAALRYCAALGPAFQVSNGTAEPGAVVLESTDPAARVVVEIDGDVVRVHDGDAPSGSPAARGSAADLIEMLSLRDAGAEVPSAVRALVGGLAAVFDQAG